LKIVEQIMLSGNKRLDASNGFAPIHSNRAFEEIANQIRGLISTGQLKPGDRLPSERALAEELQVSRNTLREALRALELGGLLELRKGATGGAFIVSGNTDVVINGLRDLYHLGAISPKQLTEARVWIEATAVRVACERMTDAELAELEANVNAAEKAEKDGDFERRAELHLDFHSLLGKATKNPILSITVDGIMEITRQFVKSIGPQVNRYVLPSRRRLLAHLRARDADSAVMEMQKHLERLHRHYLSKLTKVETEGASD
jgi:GntR family transcriptional repressor for pyruvate dehydrogenase complex